MSRKDRLFGQHHHKGTAGGSTLSRGVRRRVRDVDPVNVIDLLDKRAAKKRKVRLRREPVDE